MWTLDDIREAAAGEVYLVELHPRAPDGGPADPVYLATRDVLLPHDDPDAPDREYLGGVTEALSREADLYASSDGPDGADDVTLGGASVPKAGATVVALDAETAAERLPVWRDLAWDGAPITVRRGPPDGHLADFETVFEGRLSGDIQESADGIEFQHLPLDAALDRPLNPETYGEAELGVGAAVQAGDPKPIAVGRFAAFKPVLTDKANGWWDVAPTVGLTEIGRVEDGGFAIAESTESPPPDGHYFADLEQGRIQFTSGPQFGLRVSGLSAYAGGADTPGALLDALIADAGLTPTGGVPGLDDAIDAPVVGTASREPVTHRDLADRLIASVGGWYAPAPGVGLDAGPLRAPDAADADGADLYLDAPDLERASVTIRRPGAPPHTLRIGHAPTVDPMPDDRLAAGAPDARTARLTRAHAHTAHVNTAAKARRRHAERVTRDTLIYTRAGARTLAGRLGPLLTAEHELVDVAIPAAPFRLPLHATVWLRHPGYGLDAAYRLLGVRESQADAVVRLKLWRPRRPWGDTP